MAISKERKQTLVVQYQELLRNNNALVMTAYSGLSVKELEGLRHNIREAGGEFHIVKNNLAKRAFSDVGIPLPEGILVGPTAIGFASEDVLGMAKAIVDLSRQTDFLEVKAAVIDGVIYDKIQITRLAELPPLPIVQAQLLSMIQAPANNVARILVGSMRQLVNVLKAYSEAEPTMA